MSDIRIIDKPGAKSPSRKVLETGMTSMIWGLWIYLLLPVLNVLLWIIGLSTINTQFFENEGYLAFIGLVQEMGLSILIAFVVMRLWGIYNYYRFGRLARRSHKSVDSILKLSKFYELKQHEFLSLESRKENIWPPMGHHEKVGLWIKEKEKKLAPNPAAANEGTVKMHFKDIRGQGIPSITMALLISLTFVFILAIIILLAAGGFQKI